MGVLKSKGIDARPFFYPLSEMPIYSKYSKSKNKVTEDISGRGFNLPTYGSLTNITEIRKILSNIGFDK
jgi:perosamine synthetase